MTGYYKKYQDKLVRRPSKRGGHTAADLYRSALKSRGPKIETVIDVTPIEDEEARIKSILTAKDGVKAKKTAIKVIKTKDWLDIAEMPRKKQTLATVKRMSVEQEVCFINHIFQTLDVNEAYAITKAKHGMPITRSSASKYASRNRIVEMATQLKRVMLEAALEQAAEEQASLAIEVLDKESKIGDTLKEQLGRLEDALNEAIPGTKAYSSIVGDITKVKDLVDKLSGLSRLREQQSLSDRAAISIELHKQKRLVDQPEEEKRTQDEVPQITMMDEDMID